MTAPAAPRKRQAWWAPPGRDAQILAARQAGDTLTAIALRHGISKGRVRQIVAALTPEGEPLPGPKRKPRPVLTRKQENVLWCISEGWTHAEGARNMGISLRTFKVHLLVLRRKFEVGSARELHACCWRYFH